MSIPAYPLRWPEGRPRNKTRTAGRTKVTLATARDDVLTRLDKLGMARVTITSNAVLRQDGLPASKQPKHADPGVAVWFYQRGKYDTAICLSCDKFDSIAANLRYIGLGLDELKAMCEHLSIPIRQIIVLLTPPQRKEPPPQTEWEPIKSKTPPAEPLSYDPYRILGVSNTTPWGEIVKAYEYKLKETQNDVTGRKVVETAMSIVRKKRGFKTKPG